MSPRLIPIRNLMRRASATPAFLSAISAGLRRRNAPRRRRILQVWPLLQELRRLRAVGVPKWSICGSDAIETVEDVVELAIEHALEQKAALEIVRSRMTRRLMASISPSRNGALLFPDQSLSHERYRLFRVLRFVPRIGLKNSWISVIRARSSGVSLSFSPFLSSSTRPINYPR
jgi:hypothetical protein